MKQLFIALLFIAVLGFTSVKYHSAPLQKQVQPLQDTILQVPLGGNTWLHAAVTRKKIITEKGISNWTDRDIDFNTYIRVNKTGTLHIKLNAKTAGESKLKITIAGKQKIVRIKGNEYQQYAAGEWILKDTGYIKINLSGLEKSGQYFADISDYEISGTAVNAHTSFTKNNEGNFFYWGRRGPSVHLNYPFADTINAEYFYNEITVPAGQDVIGSYYMANGFGEGYFGIQVNSPTERRILFSVWSPFSTDDPKSIPDEMRIVMLKKGEDVHAGEFGNEGSGGQSFMRYNWKAGSTYRFLLRGQPDGNGSTIYTAWFFAPEKDEWMLIASFKRPKTDSWLKRFHSFLENFIPEQGDKTREVLFGNQWVCTAKGEWIPLNKAVFTYDNTAAKGYRMDYAGGVDSNDFFLRNCGFFNKYTTYKSVLERPAVNKKPVIDFKTLP